MAEDSYLSLTSQERLELLDEAARQRGLAPAILEKDYWVCQTRRPDGQIIPTPTFILSFDAIIGDAECRNHTFLEILKSGMKALEKADATPIQPSVAHSVAP